jgi:hypothetical protein
LHHLAHSLITYGGIFFKSHTALPTPINIIREHVEYFF